MDWAQVWAIAVAMILPAAFVQMFPLWQRQFLFTVRVPEGFAASADGRRIVRRFRARLWAVAAVCSAALWFGAIWAPLVNALAILLLIQWARMETRSFAVAGGTLRQAALTVGEEDSACFAWWTLAPVLGLLLLALTAAYLLGNREAIPARFPTHWGVTGEPDRWSAKSVSSVFGLFGIGVAVQAMLGFISYAMAADAGAVMSPRRRMNLQTVAFVSLAVSALHVVLDLIPLRQTAQALPGPMWVWFLLPALFMAPALWLGVRAQRLEDSEAEPTRDDAWIGGIWYSNRDDARMMLPNRMGPGHAYNFGHPGVRVAVPAVLALLFVSIFGLKL
ncbi:MAG: DUF1648 domain-containing protein [Acidobacteria bacterium]|nr:DUF1648 domain-containing protein [Acidobacteriota bacterium]